MLAHMCKAERREGLGREKPNTLPNPVGSLPKLLIEAGPLNWIGWGNALQSWLHSFPQGIMQEGPSQKSYYPQPYSVSSEVSLSHFKGNTKHFSSERRMREAVPHPQCTSGAPQTDHWEAPENCILSVLTYEDLHTKVPITETQGWEEN